ncbi:MAG: class I SAM-dependent methyltransferase, partial [Pseudonocardia sp.]|nr:class I SAM-dependent methyltransferase [Pseudonocardia sp.]
MSLGGSPAEWRARLSEPGSPVCAPDWLALREPADAAARSTDLLGDLAPAVIHDLGCGTGSMLRWLAPRLPTPQHWVLHDRDTALLDRAVADLPPGVTAETRAGEMPLARPRGPQNGAPRPITRPARRRPRAGASSKTAPEGNLIGVPLALKRPGGPEIKTTSAPPRSTGSTT